MLIVISIISVLLGMLYGALERAQKFTRRTITYSELKSIESAWKQYYAHYHAWPSNDLVNAASRLPPSGEDLGFVIDAPLARMLQGVRETDSGSDLGQLNPEAIPFIEFARYSAVTRAPVNPFKANSSSPQDMSRSYNVLFDTNGDRQITVPSGDAQSPTNAPVIGSVAVWTVIPATRTSNSSGQTEPTGDVILGSWESFSVK
jgi:type II secretory pathway pseudopilin PulG